MRPNATRSASAWPSEGLAPRDGVLVLTGYGLRIRVEHNRLVVADGAGRQRRTGEFVRATAKLKRLVALGHTGYVTLDALRWLHDIGGAFVQIDADGAVLTVSAPLGLNDARLRRAQALAAMNGSGMELAAELVRRKLQGQLRVLDRSFPDADHLHSAVEAALGAVAQTTTPERMRLIEAAAASAYWSAWSAVPVRFARTDADRVPGHWRAFGARTSPLTGSPRSAANSANALLNYAYAILESEARIAALAIGLDPGIGVYHADLQARDSLACDVMEAVRPDVDAWLLQLLRERTFAFRDFFEVRTGVCRLMPAVAQSIAEWAPAMRKLVAPVTEYVAQQLMRTTPSGRGKRSVRTGSTSVPSLLTGSRRREASHAARGSLPRVRPESSPSTLRGCKECGVVLSQTGREICDECLPEATKRQRDLYSQAGPAKLAALRAVGRDPAHGGTAAGKRRKRHLEQTRAAADWEGERGDAADPDEFRREILPGLQAWSLREIRRRTGLSLRYCSQIRRGEKIPHQRHWEALRGGSHKWTPP